MRKWIIPLTIVVILISASAFAVDWQNMSIGKLLVGSIQGLSTAKPPTATLGVTTATTLTATGVATLD